MKKLFLSLSILAQVVFSMEKEEVELDTKYTVEEYNKPVEQAISPSHTLPNFAAYSFIECLKPGEVLFSVTTEKGLNVSNEFKDFFVVCHQAERYGDAYYFVPENMKKDAEKALALYSKTSPGFYAYLIPIKDDRKFCELAAKTTPGCANKSGAWENDLHHRYGANNENWVDLYNGDYKLLDKERVRYAKNSPEQNDTWSCGPNSGFRALRLLNEKNHDFNSFIQNGPKTFSKERVMVTADAVTGVMGLFSTIFFSDSLAALTYSVISDVGPNPSELGRYLSSKMTHHKAYYSGYSDAVNRNTRIRKDIELGFPTIILLISGTLSMHYVNIIGIKPCTCEDCDGLTDIVILDTDREIGVMTCYSATKWMDRDGYANQMLDSRYNAVEFSKK